MATTSSIFNHISSVESDSAALQELTPNPDSFNQLQADLTAGSKVSIHRTFRWIFAYLSKLQQGVFDTFKREHEDLAKDRQYGTRRWFVSKALLFQMGHQLIHTPLDGIYLVSDPQARIVTHAAVVELANQVIVKVAKAQGTGLVKLSPVEALAVNDYFQELRPPVQVTVLTADADRLRIFGTVIYDGQTGLAAVQASVNFHVREYLKTLAFGGVVVLTELKAHMMQAQGVVDIRMTGVEVRTTGPWVLIPRLHYTYSGHAVIDAAHPISTTLQWQVGNI